MSNASPAANLADLSPEDAFEDAWRRHYHDGGEIPRLADFLPSADHDDCAELIVHLIEIDLERRWCAPHFAQRARGLAETFIGPQETPVQSRVIEPQPVADYLRQLNWPAESDFLPGLLAAEYEARRRGGQPVSPNDYFQQYPRFREELRERFAVIDEDLRHERQKEGEEEPFPEIPGFEIERILGSGGNSTVYLAREPGMHRQVAIKYALRVPRDAHERARFELETAVQAQFTHPNVVRIHGKGVHHSRPYLVCDYIAGQSLREAIKSEPLAPRRAAAIVARIARTMHDVHDAGILHRDLKPENILLDKADTPLIADFGIAKIDRGHDLVQRDFAREGALTMQGDIMGTPAYMAPEQASGAIGHDRRVDVYGLGGVLYAVLTGRPPFFAAMRDEIMRQVKHDEPVEPRRLNPHIPRDLNTICLKCLSKHPQRRYATAREVAEDLERFLRGEPILARPVSAAERVFRWCARNRAVASLLAAVAILFIFGTTVSAYYAKAAFDARDRLDQEQIAVAHQLIQKSNVGGALRLLDSIESRGGSSRTEGFVWDFALRESHSEQLALADYSSAIAAVTVSPDGKLLATATAAGELRIVRAASGEVLTSAPLQLPISAIVFNHDGSRLAVATGDGGVAIWQVEATACREIHKYTEHLMPIQGLAFHPRENLVASVSAEAGIHVWEADSGLTLLQQTDQLTSFINSLSFAADGNSLWVVAHGQTDTAQDGVWQLDLQTEQFQQVPLELTTPSTEEPATIRRAALSINGQWLLVLGSDLRVRGFHVGELAAELKAPELKWTIPVARSDARFVMAREWFSLIDSSAKSLVVYGLEHGLPLRTIRGHTDRLTVASASHDGSVVAVAARNRVLKIWNGNEETNGPTLRGHQGWIKVLALSSDGQTLASGGNDFGVYLWDAETGKRLHRLGKHEVKNAPTSDGTLGALRSVGTYFGHEAFISGIGFSPDNRQVITLGEDSRLMVWDRATGQREREIPLRVPQTRGLAVHPERSEAVFFSMHGVVYFFDWQGGEQTGELKLPGFSVTALAYAPDGSVLATGDKDGSLRLWKDKTRELQTTLKGLEGSVQRLVFNKSGTLLAAGDAQGAIRVWRLPNPEPMLSIESATDRYAGLSFTPDDQLITTGGRDELGTLKIWDLSTGQELLSLPGDFTHVVATPDGARIAAATGKWYTVRILDSRPVDKRGYRKQPVALKAPPEIETPPLGTPPPLRALGYFAADAVPYLNDLGSDDVFKASPANRANRFVAVKLIVPQSLEMATPEEFEKYYKEWDEDGTAPIERSHASLQLPSRFTLHAGDGSKYVGKLHGAWPLVAPSLGFRGLTGFGRHFEDPRPLDRNVYIVLFEVPRDQDLSDLQIQMRADPPIAVPNKELAPPAADGKPVALR